MLSGSSRIPRRDLRSPHPSASRRPATPPGRTRRNLKRFRIRTAGEPTDTPSATLTRELGLPARGRCDAAAVAPPCAMPTYPPPRAALPARTVCANDRVSAVHQQGGDPLPGRESASLAPLFGLPSFPAAPGEPPGGLGPDRRAWRDGQGVGICFTDLDHRHVAGALAGFDKHHPSRSTPITVPLAPTRQVVSRGVRCV